MRKKASTAAADESKTVLEPAKKATAAKGRKTAAKTAAAKTAEKTTATKTAAVKNKETAAAKKPAARKTTKKTAKTAAADFGGSHQTKAEVSAQLAVEAAEAKDGVAYMEGVQSVAKKQAKKAAAAADFEGSHQTKAQVAAQLKVEAEEAKAGAAISEGIANLGAAVAADQAANQNDFEGSHQSSKEVAQALAVEAAETKAGVAYMEGVAKAGKEAEVISEADAEAASRKVLAAKAAAHTYGQVNLSARSKADGAAAAKGFKKPKRKKASAKTKAAKAAAKPATKTAEFVIAAISSGEIVEILAKAEAASRAVLSGKGSKTAVQNALSAQSIKAAGKESADNYKGSHQSEAEVKAAVAQITAEAADGVKVMEGVAAVTGTPYLEETAEAKAEAASRKCLASKAGMHSYGQINLSARSKASAKADAKGFKKPVRNKAKQSKDQVKAVQEQILAEMNDGARLERLIPQVEGTPYKDVIANMAAKAAKNSRAALASKARTVKGVEKFDTNVSDEQKEFYGTLDDQTLLDMWRALGVDRDYDTLLNDLTAAQAVEDVVIDSLREAKKAGSQYTFDRDGFDASVIPYLCARLADRIPNKKEDNVRLAAKIDKDVDRMLINEGMNDSAIYKDLFDDVREVLVYAQRNNIERLDEMEAILPADLHKLIDRFMTVAYTILPGWQYNDVKYYEGFLYSVMAQFDDLAGWQNRALMDLADLYILHGDYNKGNEGYAYVLRENQIKDQIYYRFANVYVPFDLQRAKGIVRDALRVIDGRYDYYNRLIDILNK